MRSVEVSQPMRVRREVRGHPIEDHAYALLVQVIHQVHKVLRSSITRCGREVAGGLVSPRSKKRMLHNRQQLYMREVHAPNVFSQFGSHLPVTERAIVILRDAHPLTQG